MIKQVPIHSRHRFKKLAAEDEKVKLKDRLKKIG